MKVATTTECTTSRLICFISKFGYTIRRTRAARPQSQPAVLIPMLHRRLPACITWPTSSRHRARTIPVPPTTDTRSIGLIGAKTSAATVATTDVTGYQAANRIRPVPRDRAAQVRARTVT